MKFQEVPLEDGFVYRTFTPSHGGFVKNNKVYNRNYGGGCRNSKWKILFCQEMGTP